MKFLPILLCLFLGGDMVVDIAYNQTVQDLRSTEITISGNNLKSNKAKVFINGGLKIIEVQNGSFEITYQSPLDYGENKFQIDVTCKGEYYQSKIIILNRQSWELKLELSECIYENEFMIPVESLKSLGYQIENLPSLAVRIYNDISVIIKEGIKEINIDGKTLVTDIPPMLINNKIYIPISMIAKIPSITATVNNEIILRRVK